MRLHQGLWLRRPAVASSVGRPLHRRIPCTSGAPVRHHIYGHGSHHGHGHGHGHPEGEDYEPWQFPKEADPRSFFQPPEPERADIALHVSSLPAR